MTRQSKAAPNIAPPAPDLVQRPKGHHFLTELLDCPSCGPQARGDLASEARERLDEQEAYDVAVAKHPALEAGIHLGGGSD